MSGRVHVKTLQTPQTLRQWGQSYVDGILSRCVFFWDRAFGRPRDSHGSNLDAIVEFYKKWRYRGEDQSIVDLGSPLYRELLTSVIQQFPSEKLGSTKVIFDVGCGALTLLRLIIRLGRKPRYVGLDSWIGPQEEIFAREYGGRLIEGSVEHGLSVPEEAPFSIISCINLLSYVSDLDGTLDFLISCANDETELLIVEPVPSLYWENYFSGIQIFMRSPQALEFSMRSRGWELCRRTSLQVLVLGGIFRTEIAVAQVFQRHAL